MSAATLKGVCVTVLGLGHLRPAPGTWGSMPPPALALALLWLGAAARLVDAILVALGVAASLACLRFGAWAQARYGRSDPRQVVADETAGQCLALLGLPWRSGPDETVWNIALAATAFLSFRLFDILKPPPARSAERLPGGRGILADDLFAGAYALGITHLLAWAVLPRVL